MKTLVGFLLLFSISSANAGNWNNPKNSNSRQLDQICTLLLSPKSRPGNAESDALRSWFKADLTIKQVALVTAPLSSDKSRETVIRAQIEDHSPILGAHRSDERRAQHIQLQGVLNFHLDGWDWSAKELPLVRTSWSQVPIQIMSWRTGRRYYRVEPTYVAQNFLPLVISKTWVKWSKDEKLRFLKSALTRTSPLSPGYRIRESPLSEMRSVKLRVRPEVWDKAIASLYNLIEMQRSLEEIDSAQIRVTWMTNAIDQVLALHFDVNGQLQISFGEDGDVL